MFERIRNASTLGNAGRGGRAMRLAMVAGAAALATVGSAGAAPTPAPSDHALAGPRPALLQLAESAADRYLAEHDVPRPRLLTVIDYSLPSTEPRLWVIDRAGGRVLFHRLVAHGRGSGENYATRFSNREGSRQSSLGLFLTEETYIGSNGYSLRLRGLESGINDRARQRTIVIHGAWYVTPEFARQHGRLGRSWGCPALHPEIARAVIDRIRDGSLLFVYAPDADWLTSSRYLNQTVAAKLRTAVGDPIAAAAP